MNETAIYTVTTLRGALAGDTRCVGFYHNKAHAVAAIEHNDFDINECGHYNFAVVEKVMPGLYNLGVLDQLESLDDPEFQTWFQWHYGDKKYKPCKKPEPLKNTVSFGIG